MLIFCLLSSFRGINSQLYQNQKHCHFIDFNILNSDLLGFTVVDNFILVRTRNWPRKTHSCLEICVNFQNSQLFVQCLYRVFQTFFIVYFYHFYKMRAFYIQKGNIALKRTIYRKVIYIYKPVLESEKLNQNYKKDKILLIF